MGASNQEPSELCGQLRHALSMVKIQGQVLQNTLNFFPTTGACVSSQAVAWLWDLTSGLGVGC